MPLVQNSIDVETIVDKKIKYLGRRIIRFLPFLLHGGSQVKVIACILIIFSNSVFAGTTGIYNDSIKKDLEITLETSKRIVTLIDYYHAEITPLLNKLIENEHVVYTRYEVESINSFWTQYINHRIVLHTIYQSINASDNNYAKQLVRYSANLQLQTSAAALSLSNWKNKAARKKLNETNTKSIPRGSFISMENELFRNVNKVVSDELPTYFPTLDIQKDFLSFSQFTRLTLDNNSEELEALNLGVQKQWGKLKTFVTASGNLGKVKRRFFVYRFKNIFYNIMRKISTWMGDTKVRNRDPSSYNGQTLVDIKLAKKMESLVLPGDVMLSRTDWFLSNIFLPGFWMHSFIYLGNEQKLQNFFSTPEINKYFKQRCIDMNISCSNIVEFLQRAPSTKTSWKEYLKKDHDGFENVLIEATSEGIHFSSIKHTFLNDFLAAMRPKLSKLAKAKSIIKAVENFGLEYDFVFDYQTDDRMVCSELVAKSYAKDRGKAGFEMNYSIDNKTYLEINIGTLTLPVKGFINKAYDENVLKVRKPEFDFIAFLKGNKKTKTAHFVSEKEFYRSREYPKWDFMR